jgi:hypothetical protein
LPNHSGQPLAGFSGPRRDELVLISPDLSEKTSAHQGRTPNPRAEQRTTEGTASLDALIDSMTVLFDASTTR